MKTWFRGLVRSQLQRFGYDIVRHPPAGTVDGSNAMFAWLRAEAKIGTVIDIGANDGAFAEFLQGFFKAERTLAFEPLPAARAQLEARKIPGAQVFACALADAPGRTHFEVNQYGPASSMLKVSQLSRTAFPQTADVAESIDVEVARLDDVVDLATLPRGIFVKMDVQGVEDKVIAGGANVLRAADYVMIEASFRPMYDSQPLFEEVHAGLAALGLRMAGLKNQIAAASGEPLFAHFLYRADRLLAA